MLQWIYKTWIYFWRTLLVLIGIIILLGGGAFGLLQLNPTKKYISNQLEDEFNRYYKGTIHIEELEGLLPFNFQLSKVSIRAPVREDSLADSTAGSPVITVENVSIGVHLSGLMRRNLIIDRLDIQKPLINLIASDTGGYTIQQAFRPEQRIVKRERNLFNRLKVVAPYLNVESGRLNVEKWPETVSRSWTLPQPFTADSIDVSLYVELADERRFLDIEHFSAYMPKLALHHINSSGQIFNRDSLLELNGFQIQTRQSSVNLTGSVTGINIWKGNYPSQLRGANYNMDVDTAYINLQEWVDLIPGLPVINESVGFRAEMIGDHDELNISQFDLFMDQSRLAASGTLQHLFDRSDFRYRMGLDTVAVYRSDLKRLVADSIGWTDRSWEKISGGGLLTGSADTMNTDLRMQSNQGSVSGKFKASIQSPYSYEGSLKVDSLNLAAWLPGRQITRGRLNAQISGSGMGVQWQDAVWNLSGTVSESYINNIPLDHMDFQVNFIEGFIEPTFTLRNPGPELIKGEGWVDLKQKPLKLHYTGSASGLNLQHYTSADYIQSTRLNLDYNIELTGNTLSTLYGQTSVDVGQSVIGGDTVQSHSFYADLDDPDSENRQLRLTSSLMDLEMSGDVFPKQALAMYRHWKPYLTNVVQSKILLDSTRYAPNSFAKTTNLNPLDLSAEIQLKNAGMLNHYFDFLPALLSNSKIDAQITADAEKMLIRSAVRDSRLQIGSLAINSPMLQLTGNFRYDQSIQKFGSFNLEGGFEKLTYQDVRLTNYKGNVQLDNDSISYQHQVEQPESDAQFSLNVQARIIDNALRAQITQFNIGNKEYTWSSVGDPKITYMRSGQLKLDQFRFRSQEEEFQIEGVFSSNLTDSVNYQLQNIHLHRVSQLLGGRVNFGGTLNGNFHTRALTTQPSIEGEINISQFTLNDRLVGDIKFKSVYSSADKLFNTQINIQTDSTKYADYLKQNEDIGQNIRMNGYLQPPNVGGTKDHLFKFNVDFREIDMWVVREIVPDILEDVEGRAEGSGWIVGSLSDYDFHADFKVDEVKTNTAFLNTNYWLNGHVEFDKTEGLVFHEVKLSDQHGGSGQLVGRVDLNNFNPVKHFDLTLSLNRLQFLNNKMDQEVPFFGEMYGSGELHLSGTNKDPYLHTTQTIRVTESSKLSIPLMEETELNQDSRFIQFVDQFYTGKNLAFNQSNENESNPNGNQDAGDIPFTELFRLDLQFEAPENTTVKLIFDPVTGDILTAQGTGQLNIRLEDGEVRMFGNYNIDNGSYQFVSGDIFTRVFSLESGGQLTWQGNPDNAELDITAVYNARPSVSSLMGNRRSTNNTDQQSIQNIPVDLVLHITGTLSSISNEFYFRLPNTMEISQNVAIANRISQLNRDEEQKLLQATSLLLTGEFIPVTANGMGSEQPYFGDNLSGSSVVLNPLLSNQVFSPLLSNQINSLLNSDISSLDVDINLNAYNQVDLGIALRLYNNRLVLRREGQVTGPQSNLGSLGATYRINRSLSIKAFHRQDLTLSNLTNTQTQVEYLNGAGLEARVQFNSWKDLTRRFFNGIKRLFTGGKAVRDDEEDGELADVKEEKEEEE